MAQPQVIDARLLYQVGRASTAPAPRDPNQGWLTRQMFSLLGRASLGYFNDAWDKKKALAAKNENADLDWASTIAEEKGPLKERYAQSIEEWTKQRNKGQNLVALNHGFPGRKGYKKGIALVNNAQMKIENLYTSASSRLKRKNDIKQMEKNGTITTEGGETIKAKYSSGTTGPQMYNSISLADGSMDHSLYPNPETGFLEQVVEKRKGGFGPKGFADETTIETIPFNEIRFAGYEDTTHHNMSGKYRDSGTKFGAGGIEWDESHEMGIRADIAQDVSEMSEPAFRSWFFGGTQYKYTDSGKNFMTPAQDFIAEKYPELTKELQACEASPNTVGCDQAKQEYEGILNTLKLQDLNSPEYQQFAIQSMLDVNKQFHETALEVYKEKHKPKPKQYKPDRMPNVKIDGNISVPNARAKQMAYNMRYGKGIEYGKDDVMYKNDGKGKTEIHEQDKETVTIKNEYGETVNVIRGTGEYKYKRTIPTNQAMKKRGLDGFYDPYPTTSETPETVEEVPFGSDQEFGGGYVRGGGQMTKNFKTAEDYLTETD